MNEDLMIIERIGVLFIALAAGLYARRRGFLDAGSTKKFSEILLNVTQPLLTIVSFQIAFSSQRILTGLGIIAVSVGVHLLAAALGRLAFLKLPRLRTRNIFEMVVIFSNCSYIGYPILKLVFGDEVGIFYGAFYTIFFNVFIWTYGIILLHRGEDETPKLRPRNIYLNVGVVSTVIGIIVFAARIRLPGVIFDSMTMIGNMTFPLAMMIVGSLMAYLPFGKIFRDPKMYFLLLVRLIAQPAIVLGLCLLLRLPRTLSYIAVLMSALPAGAMNSIFAETHGADAELAAASVGITTLFSVLTVPAVVMTLNAVYR